MKASVVAGAFVVAASSAIFACSETRSDVQSEADAWDYRGQPSNLFLSEHGLGSKDESLAYYASIISAHAETTYTLEQWKSEWIGPAPVFHALYRNAIELGFWREMTCTQTIAAGIGGCMVTNWRAPDEPARGVPNQGTVAMNVSPDGFARFYVFLPDGSLSPSAVLDEEGPKFMPRLCTVCHSGFAPNPGRSPNLRSIFREFEPSLLQEAPAVPRALAEKQWRDLNGVARRANEAIVGADHARDAVNARIDALYAGGDPLAAPTSWRLRGREAEALYTKVVAPYCVTCHRHNAYDWTDYANFEFLHEPGVLADYLPDAPDPNSPVGAMPQAALTFKLLQKDAIAKKAIANWLAATPCEPAANACAPGDLDVTSAGCAAGESRQRTCTDRCRWDAFSDCAPAGELTVPEEIGGVRSTVVTLDAARTAPRLEGNCPLVTPPAFTATPFSFVEVKNPSKNAAVVAIYNSRAPDGPVLDTILAAYDGSAIPSTDAQRRACVRGVGDVGTESLTGDADFASLDGFRSVTIPAGASVEVYVASFFASHVGKVLLNVKTLRN